MLNINTIRAAFNVYAEPLPSSKDVCEFLANNYEPNELLRIVNKIITFEQLMHRNVSLEDIKKWRSKE